jgi:hypothetical protein
MDLKKIILQILEESHLHLPREIYKDIMDYYIEMYKRFKIDSSKRVTPKRYPSKKFWPDFSCIGKSYQWVKDYKPSVTLQFTADNDNQWCDGRDPENTIIQVSLDDPERVYTEVLEHELLHSLQFLLKTHEQNRRNQVHPKDVRLKKGEKTYVSTDPSSIWKARLPRVEYAGAPKKKYINHEYSWHGYKKDSSAKKRTIHANRPIEYYPDLLSSIRQMQKAWYKFALYHKMDEKEVKSEEKKKKFYMFFYNNIKNGQPYPDYIKNYIPILSERIFERFKNSGNEFVTMMLNKLYDGFVNKDIPFDYDKFKEIQKQTETDAFNKGNEKLLKYGIKEGNFTFNSKLFKFNYDDRSYIFKFVEDEKAKQYIGYQASVYANEVFSEIGLTPKEDKNQHEYVIIPSKIGNVIKIFKKIEQLKKTSRLFKRAGEHTSNILWDNIKQYFVAYYKKGLSTELIPNLDKRWFQNIPQEERAISRENYYKQIEDYKQKFEDLINSIYTESL